MNDFENYVYEPIDLWLVIMKSLFSGNRCTATVPRCQIPTTACSSKP